MASPEFHPVKLDLLTVKMFMIFLFSMGRKNYLNVGSILGRREATKYRSALMDLYRDSNSQSMMTLIVS